MGLQTRDLVNVLLHVMLLSTFIVIFFFSYDSYVEGQVVKNSIISVVNSCVDDIILLVPEGTIPAGTMDSLTVPDLEEEDSEVEKSNAKLLKKAGIFIGIFLAVGLVVIAVLWTLSINHEGWKFPKGKPLFRNNAFSIGRVCAENFVMLLFVALSEFIFTMFIAANYKPLDNNSVKRLIIKNLVDYSNG